MYHFQHSIRFLSVYDGEVFNGLRHGFGTFRCADGRLSYTGEWTLGKRHGKVRARIIISYCVKAPTRFFLLYIYIFLICFIEINYNNINAFKSANLHGPYW